MRIETVFVSILAVLVFIVSFYQFNNILLGILFAVIFLGLYVLFSCIIQKVRMVQESYEVTEKHLHVTRKKGSQTKKEKVSLKDVVHHRLDKLFLGGYLLAESGKGHLHKHLLFFNSREELEKFEKFLKKRLKKKSKK